LSWQQQCASEAVSDEPAHKGATGNTITYITDPWGTRIEIIERGPLGPVVQ
jgi:hypothetical protein